MCITVVPKVRGGPPYGAHSYSRGVVAQQMNVTVSIFFFICAPGLNISRIYANVRTNSVNLSLTHL